MCILWLDTMCSLRWPAAILFSWNKINILNKIEFISQKNGLLFKRGRRSFVFAPLTWPPWLQDLRRLFHTRHLWNKGYYDSNTCIINVWGHVEIFHTQMSTPATSSAWEDIWRLYFFPWQIFFSQLQNEGKWGLTKRNPRKLPGVAKTENGLIHDLLLTNQTFYW